MTSTRYSFTGLFVLFICNAQAQVSLGLRGGLALSDAAFQQVEGPALPDLDLSTQSRAGLSASLIMDIPLSGHFSLMPELGYLQRGFKQQAPAIAHVGPGAVNSLLDYIEGALLGRFHIGHGAVQPHFLAGVMAISWVCTNTSSPHKGRRERLSRTTPMIST